MIKNIVEKYIGLSSHVEQGDQHFYQCPKCGSSRFTVNYDRNVFRCWKCDYSSKSVIPLLYDLEASYEDINEVKKILGIKDHYSNKDEGLQAKIDKIVYGEKKKENKLYKSKSWRPVTTKGLTYKLAQKYLSSRGVSKFEMKYYDIHYDLEDQMLVFPSYDMLGDLNFYVKRSIGDYKYYKNCDAKKSEIVFWESLVDFERPIILTEGIFDAIKLGDNTIPLLGSIMTNRLYRLLLAFETPEVTVFLDRDAENSMMKMTEKLFDGGLNVKRVFLEQDIDAGDLHKKEVVHYLESSENINKFSLLRQNLNRI